MKKIILAMSAAALLVACGGQSTKKKQEGAETKSVKSNVILTAAGATFPLPYYNLAFKTYNESTGVNVTYGGVGSGGGIRSVKDQVVDFGGTDAYLSDAEMSEMPSTVVHIPTCMGAVVMAYNLEGVEKLNLNAEIISDIYLGKIKSWDDAKIATINKGVKLPKLAITPAYRSDGSGTTFVFSDYMTKASKDWAEKMGTGKSLKWEHGIAAKGNPGVAGIIKQTNGAVGYIGSEYAFAVKVPTAALQNPNGEFIMANTESISAAANVEIVPDTRQMITNSPASGAYPISCFTWIILYKEQGYASRTAEQAKENVQLLKWMISPESQELTTKVHYSPLPAAAVTAAQTILNSITFNGQPIQ